MNQTTNATIGTRKPDNLWRSFIIVIYVIIGIFALVGNCIVLHVLRVKSSSRRKVGFMFANMAVADLLTALVIIPMMLVKVFLSDQDIRWVEGPFGVILCKITETLMFSTISASILTLTIMSLDRYCGIMLPYQRIDVFSHAKPVTAFIWIASFAMMSPIAVIATTRTPGRPSLVMCQRIWGELVGRKQQNIFLAMRIFYSIILGLLYIIPVLLMSVIYSAICYRLWFHKRPGEVIPEDHQRAEKRKRKVIRMLVIIVVVFALCWLPPHVLHILMAFNYDEFFAINPIVRELAFIVGQANSAINPCLYITLNSQLRKDAIQVFCCDSVNENGVLSTIRSRVTTFTRRGHEQEEHKSLNDGNSRSQRNFTKTTRETVL